ncbi:MAG TPA: hypothetical protein VF595_00130 [Tepidisphaeraceae bacterium]|jgi:hypothetical protein
MRKTWVAAAILVSAGLAWAVGQPGVVRTREGGVYDGLVEERDTSVVVTIRGIDTTLARDTVESITYGEFEPRWTEAYDKLDAKDVPGRVAAARRAFEERRYDLAERALRDAQGIDPNNAEAADLLRLTMNQRRLERNAAAPGSTPTPADTPETPVIKPPPAFNTLSPDEVNRVKQMETRESDTKMRFNFASNVRKRFYDATPAVAADYPTYNDFARAMPAVQATRIIRDGTAEMVKDVKVTNDPEMMVEFRRDVMPLILQGCATSQCHGGSGPAAAKFSLISPATDVNAAYTNFYVLQSTKIPMPAAPRPSAEPGGNTVQPDLAHMVDRTRPEMSLVLQHGLSDQFAQIKHPRVRGYNGIYTRGREDPRYKTVLAFLSTLNPVQPEYGLEFKLQRQGAAPATQP